MNFSMLLKTAVALPLVLQLAIMADDEGTKAAPDIFGYASIETGEIMKGYNNGTRLAAPNGISTNEIDHGWVERAYIGLGCDASINEHLRLRIGGEGMMNISFNIGQRLNDQWLETQRPLMKFSLWRGEGIYSSGDPAYASIEAEAGFFPYKYNPDARNLGEYLFRTGCYPPLIINRFDRPYADLLGLRLGNSLWGCLHEDLFLTSEITEFLYPPGDFSLSYIVDYSFKKIFSVGAGASLYRVFSVNAPFTTPKDGQTAYQIRNKRAVPGSATDSTADTSYLTYAGTKLMVRFSFDIKEIIPINLMGPEDLKLYAEAAVLGLKNYRKDPSLNILDYPEFSERIPIMIGFNFPTFKQLDVLNLEIEYFSNRYPNSFTRSFKQEFPIPDDDNPLAKHSRLKWSLYAKRSLGRHVSMTAQMSNDHFIPASNTLIMGKGSQDFQDVTLRHGDWWWMLKLNFSL